MKKNLSILLSLVFFVCCSLFLVACGPDKGNNIDVTNIMLDNTAITLTEGDEITLIATLEPANATNTSMYWSSSNINVATVNSGSVIAIREGEATITVTAHNGKSATCIVTVQARTEEPVTKYTVTFNANGGKFSDNTDTYTVNIEDGTKLTNIIATSGDDYVLKGWYTDEYCTREWDFENYIVNDDTTLYAGWIYLNKYQSVINALTSKIKTERNNENLDVEILSIFTNSDGYVCFVEKDDTGVFSYSTDICNFNEIKGNDELISLIPNATLTQIKTYNDTYTSDTNALATDEMVRKFSGHTNSVIFSCTSEWEVDTEHIKNGTWYNCKIKAIIADENGCVFDYSITIVAGVANFDAVIGGQALSYEYDETRPELGEIANDFYSERIKEINA